MVTCTYFFLQTVEIGLKYSYTKFQISVVNYTYGVQKTKTTGGGNPQGRRKYVQVGGGGGAGAGQDSMACNYL